MGLYYKGENIQGAVAEGVGEVYSTEEKVIGTFEKEDGTVVALYRRVIYCTSPSTINSFVSIFNTSSIGITDIISIDGIIFNSNNSAYKINFYNSSENNGCVIYEKTDNAIHAKYNHSAFINRPMKLIIEYTKQ